MKDPNKVVSARGAVVDFELIRIKEELSVATTTVQREQKPSRRRRKLSERGAALRKKEEQPAAEVEDINVEVEAVVEEVPAPKIVRKRK